MSGDFLHVVGQVVKCDYLFLTFSDDSVRMFNVVRIIRDREAMVKATFRRIYGFDIDVGALKRESGWQ